MEQQQSNEIRAEFKMEQQQNARIEWVDVFRGLLIISMVLGHSTGLFNNFIYQFHMAGFLFISGYTTQQSKRNVLETVFYRFFTLLLPLIVAFFGLLALTKGMEAANIYSIFFSADLPPLSFTETIKQFFLHGSIYVWWLGACWFLIILFFVSCIHRLFFSFFREKYDFKYLLFSLCLLLIGYYMARNHMKSAQLDLVLIAQFYFFIGLWFKDNRYIEKLPNKQIFYVISTICSIGILYFFAYIVPVTVDYPSRRFGMPWLDFFVAINGIFAFFLLSKFAIKIHASKPLMYLGRKTLPIMMFHFMFFNVAYFILYLFQVVPLDYLQNFTATNEIGNQFWWLIAGVSILCSLLLWKVLQSFEVGRILFGQKSTLYNQIYQKIGTSRVVTQIEKAISFVKLPKPLYDAPKNMLTQSKDKYFFASIAIFAAALLLPMLSVGITVNDTIQLRAIRFSGFGELLKSNVQNELRMGRPLRIMAALNIAMDHVSNNLLISKLFQCGLILITFIAFGYFIFTLTKNKKLSYFIPIISLLLLPITFEHSPPSAFVGLACIPLFEILLAFALFCNFIDTKNKFQLCGSVILFFIASLGFEFVITFALLFPLIYLFKKPGRTSIKTFLKYGIIAGSGSLLFIISMLLGQKAVGSAYTGAQLGFVSLESSFEILKTLFCSALPGYWLTNGKYQYLFNHYKNILNSNSIYLLCLVAFLVYTGCMIYYLLKKDHDETLPFKQSYWWLVAGGLLYGVIPALPNSISAMYQGNVNSENFTSLVVTLFLYFSIMFSIGLILWQVLSHCKSQTATILIIGAICIFALPIQQMNARISMVHFSNSQRLLTIEQLFQTDVAQSLNHHVVYAPDLFETKNALFISSNYWETVAMHNNISLKTIKEFADESFSIYEDDCEFTILGGNDIVILSKKHITGANPVRISSDDYMLYDFQFEEQDGSFYRYNLSKVEDPNGKITLERSTIGSFSNLQRTAGNTLQTANILVGVYNDGWVAPDAQIQISTGSDGKVVLTGTYIKELTGNENISIYVDGVFVKEYTIENPEFSIELDSLPANKSITLHLISDFKFPATPPDLRELSFIISNLEGE